MGLGEKWLRRLEYSHVWYLWGVVIFVFLIGSTSICNNLRNLEHDLQKKDPQAWVSNSIGHTNETIRKTYCTIISGNWIAGFRGFKWMKINSNGLFSRCLDWCHINETPLYFGWEVSQRLRFLHQKTPHIASVGFSVWRSTATLNATASLRLTRLLASQATHWLKRFPSFWGEWMCWSFRVGVFFSTHLKILVQLDHFRREWQ